MMGCDRARLIERGLATMIARCCSITCTSSPLAAGNSQRRTEIRPRICDEHQTSGVAAEVVTVGVEPVRIITRDVDRLL
jgi:hypothetical protein